MSTQKRTTLITYGFAIFLCLVLTKIIVGVLLVFYADYAQRKESKLFEVIPSTIVKIQKGKSKFESNLDKESTSKIDHNEQTLKERVELMEDLAGIERYTVYKGRIL